MKTYLTTQSYDQLDESLSIIKESVESQNFEPSAWCKSLRLDWKTRYTLMNDEGSVLCDNYIGVENLDNHSDRPEIIDALNAGKGFSQRYSDSLKYDLLYGAVLIHSNKNPGERYIIRQAVTLEKMNKTLSSFNKMIWFLLLPLFIVTSLISLWTSLKVSFPMRSLLQKVDRMKVTGQGDETTYLLDPNDEWDIIEHTLDKAQGNINKFINELYVENEKISALLESISDSIIAIDKEQRVLFLNNHFRKNFLDRELRKEELSKLKFAEIIRHLDVKNLIEQVFSKESPVKKRNIELPIKNGPRTAFFTVKLSPMFDNNKKLFGIVMVFADVTDQKMAEQMREDFVANVSHEVRTPLTSLKGYAQMAKTQTSDGKSKELLEKIEYNSDRLTELFQDILNLSVIESTARVDKEAVSVEDITSTTLLNLKQIYRDKNFDVKAIFEIDTIWANPSMMEQVLNNLIENAIKYTPSGSLITVRWRRGKKGFNDVLEISDNGPGIEKSHLSRIFERFYRVDPSRSRELGGTGLGLSIVKHIVQIHEGKVEVHSEVGYGTTFQIKIPAYNPNI